MFLILTTPPVRQATAIEAVLASGRPLWDLANDRNRVSALAAGQVYTTIDGVEIVRLLS